MPWFQRQKFFSWFIPPLLLAAVILFFSGCLPRGLAVIEKPLSASSSWFYNVWSTWFPETTSASYCSVAESGLLTALAVDLVDYKRLEKENENLRAQLDFFERESFKHVAAQIISRSSSPIDSRFVIDRGADDGVQEGAAVVVSSGHMIGKVLMVSSKTSIVQSILGRGARTAVSLFNTSRTLGISEGGGGTLLSLRFIPQNESVSVNNLVVTSGLEELIPSGLVIGVVTSVERDSAAPFQEAVVEPLVDIRQFSNISVIVIDTGGL
ncbi:MAG: Cell shape-determining protein MreC [Candidatus Uhrbacteria bacterium GW2011_GWE2_45_35]|uniref:Cell shape-determining protein MreC n=2 Tax=Candidatus Uhriibacteriota TaxID=1752732 RepID=A0A0G1JKY7_9BACT|nr:MAG: Cell shape-determining protein MreC [Candidatus Uhrbacteria bacterium GW2011_GWF2_44_350]KKU09090.1 MAG: Cell shape-determining protein MreC [Candidatus Uhrbacteria bacterium GW2011_GWE2_45_35]HBR80341.1 rod shape-determining protein MreC [Candidatus Uhrbacteria bacterium]HCU31292.1 rod shape-determining protein MreC [Candidatus Uhrbacteria bacterium]